LGGSEDELFFIGLTGTSRFQCGQNVNPMIAETNHNRVLGIRIPHLSGNMQSQFTMLFYGPSLLVSRASYQWMQVWRHQATLRYSSSGRATKR
jgi:hypothetical protein